MKVLVILPHKQVQLKEDFLSTKPQKLKIYETSYISQKIIYDIKFAHSLYNIPISKEMKAQVSSEDQNACLI